MIDVSSSGAFMGQFLQRKSPSFWKAGSGVVLSWKGIASWKSTSSNRLPLLLSPGLILPTLILRSPILETFCVSVAHNSHILLVFLHRPSGLSSSFPGAPVPHLLYIFDFLLTLLSTLISYPICVCRFIYLPSFTFIWQKLGKQWRQKLLLNLLLVTKCHNSCVNGHIIANQMNLLLFTYLP